MGAFEYPELTLDELYKRNSMIGYKFRIYLKLRNTNDTYEDWENINLIVKTPVEMDDTVSTISYSLASDNYSFGQVKVPDCKIKLLSTQGEFGIETNASSIFFGYKRHESQIKITVVMTDEFSGQEIETEVYRGFINENSSSTKVDKDNLYQIFQIEDTLNYLLKKYTFSDVSPTSTNLNALVYEIMNRTEFTDFLTVDIGNIDAGYNVSPIAYTDGGGDASWEGQTGIIEVLEGLSTGHSFFYQKEGTFYYQPIAATGADVPVFEKDKVIDFMNFERGVDKVFEKLYWEGTVAEYIAPTIKYNRNKTFDLRGIYNITTQNGLLAHIGARVSEEKDGYKVSVPLYPTVSLLDKIQVNNSGYYPEDAFVWGRSKWGEGFFKKPTGSATIGEGQFWIVKQIKHDLKNCKTEFVVSASI